MCDLHLFDWLVVNASLPKKSMFLDEVYVHRPGSQSAGQNGVIFTYKALWSHFKFFHDLDLDSLHKYQDIIPWTCRTL